MTRYMFNFNFFAFVLSMAVLIRARDSPSMLPSITYTCPPVDEAGFALGDSDVNSDPIFCSYPAFSGENPNDFFCTYSKTTGDLEVDNDAGFCPGTAVQVTSMSKSRYNRDAHAPLPTRPKNVVRGIPDAAADRAYLKKRHAPPKVVL